MTGILPLVRRRSVMSGLPIVQLTLPANVHSFAGESYCLSCGRSEDVLKSLWQAAKDLPGWDLIDVGNVVEGSVPSAA